jgi:hypothetical protein
MVALLWWPMSYFIKNNIPVSAFFNAQAWDHNEAFVAEPKTDKKAFIDSANRSSKSTSSLDNYYSPKKYYLSSNIYNRK